MAEPATYPVTMICKLLDLSERRVQQLSREGLIPKTGRGRYELVPAVRGYIGYLRERSIDVGVVSIDIAKQRKAAAEAELSEIELAKARAAVVSVSDVANQWQSVMSSVRTRLLSVPTKVAAMAAVETDQTIVKEIIENGVHSALGELSAEDFYHSADGEEQPEPIAEVDNGEDGTASETDDQPMGGSSAEAQS
jgi:phage terminase Nu1 subunit (DNA packaging protein)